MPLQYDIIIINDSIERFQKMSLHIILGEKYRNYETAMRKLGLETLESRRAKVCFTFAKKAEKNIKLD